MHVWRSRYAGEPLFCAVLLFLAGWRWLVGRFDDGGLRLTYKEAGDQGREDRKWRRGGFRIGTNS